jgi:hypothetical protein
MEVEHGNPAVIWAHFLKQDGQEATITGIPTITIRHYQPNTSILVTDVNGSNMTQVSGSLYYYIWNYTDIYKISYATTIAGTYNTGESVTGTQVFSIRDLKIFGGGGSIWSPQEKDTVIKAIEKIINILKDTVNKDEISNEINNVEKTISAMISNIEVQNKERDKDIEILTGKIDEVDKEMGLQNIVLVGLADNKTLEKLKEFKG